MGYFENIKLSSYRNFERLELDLIKSSNVFFGKNGAGKTNILESISLFNKGRGFRNDKIINLVKKDSENFLNITNYNLKNNSYEIKVSSGVKNNKIFKDTFLNGDKSPSSKKFINSCFSFIYFLPDMERLFLSNPSFRRNFIDRMIFSYNNEYNKLINMYKKNIIERTKILNDNNYDEAWINNIENNIVTNGLEIYGFRNNQIEILIDQLGILKKKQRYPFDINIRLNDESSYNLNKEKYLNILKMNRESDKFAGGSKIGPHKSDFVFTVDKNYDASQLSTGQQKTIVLLILIAQCNYLIENKKITPILLLDEICSHLDETNRYLLLELTQSFDIQSFMTGTDETLFSFLSTNTKFYNITNK